MCSCVRAHKNKNLEKFIFYRIRYTLKQYNMYKNAPKKTSNRGVLI